MAVKKQIIFLVFWMQILSACSTSKDLENKATKNMETNKDMQEESMKDENKMIEITILINNETFYAKLYDNETTRELVAMFPMTIEMADLYSNEKFYYVSDNLPTSPKAIGNIKVGDIMLYGSTCIVLFYEDFQTTYTYTRVGYIENIENLKTIVGEGTVEVTFNTPID